MSHILFELRRFKCIITIENDRELLPYIKTKQMLLSYYSNGISCNYPCMFACLLQTNFDLFQVLLTCSKTKTGFSPIKFEAFFSYYCTANINDAERFLVKPQSNKIE